MFKKFKFLVISTPVVRVLFLISFIANSALIGYAVTEISNQQILLSNQHVMHLNELYTNLHQVVYRLGVVRTNCKINHEQYIKDTEERLRNNFLQIQRPGRAEEKQN